MSLVLVLIYGMTIAYDLLPIKRKENSNKYIWMWCALVLCLLVTTTKDYADLYNYTNYFEDVNYKGWALNYRAMPLLWGYLCRFFYWIGLEYRGMIIVLILFCMYLTHLFVKETGANEKSFWGLYLIFPGLIQIVQLRFFLGSSIVVFGTRYLLRENKTNKEKVKNSILFLASVLLGTLIHNSCAFLVVLLVVVFFKQVNVPKTIIVTIIGIVALGVLLPVIPGIIGKYINAFYLQRYFLASTSKTTLSRLIKILIVFAFNVSIAVMALHSIPQIKKTGLRRIDESQWQLSRYFTGICVLSVCLPLLVFDENFHRYFEIGFMFLYILYGRIRITKSKMIQNKTIILGSILVALIWCIYVYYPFESIVIPLFGFDGFAKIFR